MQANHLVVFLTKCPTRAGVLEGRKNEAHLATPISKHNQFGHLGARKPRF